MLSACISLWEGVKELVLGQAVSASSVTQQCEAAACRMHSQAHLQSPSRLASNHSRIATAESLALQRRARGLKFVQLRTRFS